MHGRWSVISVIKIVDLDEVDVRKSFVQMWSINVLLLSVILVGLVIRGLKEHAVIRLKYSSVVACLSILIRLKFVSPMT